MIFRFTKAIPLPMLMSIMIVCGTKKKNDNYLDNFSDFSVQRFIASIKEERNPLCSNEAMASIVVPPGEQTISLSSAGCSPVSNTMAADPSEEENLKAHVIPMGKLGTAEDVAHAVVWLCSDYAGHTTGQALSVDGGMHMA